MLVTLGNTDITQYINESSYIMSSEPVYNEWTDANYTTHRDEVRRRVKGSFTLAFVTDTDYNAFITALNAVKVGNVITVSLYVGSDINDIRTIYAHYSITPTKRRQASEGYVVSLMTMTIEEK